MYNETVMDHFANPRNVGEIEKPDGVGHTGNPTDGDKFTIYIKVENGVMVQVRFKTFGCGAAIAASSMLTIMATGKTLEEGLKITNDQVAEALGGLPKRKLACSNIAADALHAAIRDYKGKEPGCNTNIESRGQGTCGVLPDDGATLEKDQIQRYLRHIIMHQIRGMGQRTLLESKILVYAQSTVVVEEFLFYLAAAGIGNVYCYFEDSTNWDETRGYLLDLNPDLKFSLLGDIDDIGELSAAKINYTVVFGDVDFQKKLQNEQNIWFTPVLVATPMPWEGILAYGIDNLAVKHENRYLGNGFGIVGKTLSQGFLGTLMVVELIKLLLGLGEMLKGQIYFNLLDMVFDSHPNEIVTKEIKKKESFISDKMKRSKVLIIGTGGLGSPVAMTLAKAGVGTIGLVDFDTIEYSNLNRQILHSTSRVGTLKVESAKYMLGKINKNVNVITYPIAFSEETASELILEYDIIIDGLDNIPTRYILNDHCQKFQKPLMEAGVLTFYGQITTLVPGETPCYRCILPEKAETSSIPPCSEVGVLGPVPGIIGVLQATEAIKHILDINNSLKGKLLMYDGLESEFNKIPVRKSKFCGVCGDKSQ